MMEEKIRAMGQRCKPLEIGIVEREPGRLGQTVNLKIWKKKTFLHIKY